MNTLYIYSLAPAVSISLLLFFTALIHGGKTRGLAAYCLAVAGWSGALLLSAIPATAPAGHMLVAGGGFVIAAFLHSAYELTEQRSYALVWVAYLVAAGITAIHVVNPGLIFAPATGEAGPMFWPSMLAAGAAGTLPMWRLVRAYRGAGPRDRPALVGLAIAGVMGYVGAAGNAVLLASGVVLPAGLFVVLGSLFFLARVVHQKQDPARRRMLAGSLLYSAIAGFVSAGFLFGVLTLGEVGGHPSLTGYRLSALFLLVMAALAFEPVRQHLQELIGKRLLRHRSAPGEIAAALVEQEARADQSRRLAEVGAFTAAVAHEVRGPLGVLSAQLRLLRQPDPEVVDEMGQQIQRAERFVEDLLRYGRPRPLELRQVDLSELVPLAHSTARQGMTRQGGQEGAGAATEIPLELDGLPSPLEVEADQSQLLQVLVILLDNALLSLGDASQDRRLRVSGAAADDEVQLTVEDSGPGIPPEILPRLFEPFVTGRKREGPRHGTGLGLAIARGIVTRHAGSIDAGVSELGGARIQIILPRRQKILAAASGVQ